tara:strand:- start:5014 stop:5760 length:747 start_codon:yes stop_codon:yes gene_type:complete
MLDTYLYDPNQAKLELLVSSGLSILITGMPLCGKKTVIKEICHNLKINFTLLNFELGLEKNIETLSMLYNESFHLRIRHIIILYNVEKINLKEQKNISRYLNRFNKFIQKILITTKFNLIQQTFSKYFLIYFFKNYGKYEESINIFCKQFNIKFENKRKLFVIQTFQNILKYSNEDIRNILYNCIKINFDILLFYHESITYFKNEKQVYTIISKAALCEHLSNIGNKKMYYIEHFLFFLKYGTLFNIK